MATRSHSGQWIARGVHQTVWTGLLNGEPGDFVSEAGLPIHTVSVNGTFGAGGTIVLEGSNSGAGDVSTLKDQAGVTISMTGGATRMFQENPLFIRPRVTAGDGTTNLTVTLISQGYP